MTEEEMERLLDPAEDNVLSFVSLAYGRGALTAAEVRQWAWRVMELVKEADVVRLPHCVFDLTEFAGTRPEDFSIACRPHGSAGGTHAEWYAMDAISWRRGLNTKWTMVGRKAAERAGARNPHIEIRYRLMFPFVRL